MVLLLCHFPMCYSGSGVVLDCFNSDLCGLLLTLYCICLNDLCLTQQFSNVICFFFLSVTSTKHSGQNVML